MVKHRRFLQCSKKPQLSIFSPFFARILMPFGMGSLIKRRRPKTTWPSCMSAQTTNGKVKVLGHHKKGIVVLGKLRLSAAYR